MVVNRIRPIVLCKKTLKHGTLDDEYVWSYVHTVAHVTEVNGAQLQTNLFGKQYDYTYVARVRGNLNADYVAFPIDNVADDNLTKLKVIQTRKHATRTDLYFANDTEVNQDELEQ